MNLGNFLSGLIKKTGVIFADDFDIKKVDSLNNALNNIPNRGNAGDPSRVKKAKDAVTYAIIGLVIVGLAWAITSFVTKSIS